MLSRDDSFEAVVLPHLDAAHNLARWLMRDAVAAEDVLQEAMLRALTYFPSFRGVNPRAWLLQIVRNTAYDTLKLERGTRFVPLAAGGAEDDDAIGVDLPSGEDDPETSLVKARDRCRVRQLIAGLPIELRETLVLRELEEMSYKEIAEVTQTPDRHGDVAAVAGAALAPARRRRRGALPMTAAQPRVRAATWSSWYRPSSTASSTPPRPRLWPRIARNARSAGPPAPPWPAPRSLMQDGLYQPMPDDAAPAAHGAAGGGASGKRRRFAAPPLRSRLRGWWTAGIGFGAGRCLRRARIGVSCLSRRAATDLAGELVASHVRALQPGHLEDVDLDRPAHRQAVVRRPDRFRAAGEGLRRGGAFR